MIDEQAVKDAFAKATNAVTHIEDDEYRKIAFQVVFSRLLDAASPMTPVPSNARAVTSRDLTAGLMAQRLSVGEFLATVDVTSYVDRVTAIAYYFLLGVQQEGVTRQDFLGSFKTARLTPPKNISDVIAHCIRKGLLMDASEPKDGQKSWTITQTGERLIEGKLPAVEQ